MKTTKLLLFILWFLTISFFCFGQNDYTDIKINHVIRFDKTMYLIIPCGESHENLCGKTFRVPAPEDSTASCFKYYVPTSALYFSKDKKAYDLAIRIELLPDYFNFAQIFTDTNYSGAFHAKAKIIPAEKTLFLSEAGNYFVFEQFSVDREQHLWLNYENKITNKREMARVTLIRLFYRTDYEIKDTIK